MRHLEAGHRLAMRRQHVPEILPELEDPGEHPGSLEPDGVKAKVGSGNLPAGLSHKSSP